MKLLSVEVTPVRVSSRTIWVFIRVTDTDGVCGFGEATLDGRHAEVVSTAKAFGNRLVEQSMSPSAALSALPCPGNMIEAAAVSGLDQALHDLIARRQNVSVAQSIGGQRRSQIELYANINRRTNDRSPAGFASVAGLAIAAGFKAIKIAPFDEVNSTTTDKGDFARALDAGMARIASVRQVAGEDIRLMVDCHWRFDERGAVTMLAECGQFKLHWLECPVPEGLEMMPVIARLRTQAHAQGMLLAGGENIIGLDGIKPFVDAGAYDVIMPDVKYVGGLATMLELAATQEKSGIAFSPHNPSGPVAHAASLEVCSSVMQVDLLEIQFDETPMFAGVLSRESSQSGNTFGSSKVTDDDADHTDNQGVRLSGPVVTLAPQRQGLGVCIDPALFSKNSTDHVVA